MQAIQDKILTAYHNVLPSFPHYQNIIRMLSDGSDNADFPNVLLYGCEGFPHTVLWDIAVQQKFGTFTRRTCTWNNLWIYEETPYFFEIDLQHPNQPKDVMTLSDFLKEIMTHPCIHAERHIFVIKYVDTLCTRGFAYMMRVLFERFSKNAWFICTTYKLGAIESPIRSRFTMLRVPLLSCQELCTLLAKSDIEMDDSCKQHNVRNVFVATMLSSFPANMLPYPKTDFCKFHAPFIQDTLNATSPSISEIRSLTQKLSVHGFSISQIANDLLYYIKPKDKHAFVEKASEIDHTFKSTEGYRKPIYIEWLIHTAIYGFNTSKK